jgi:glycyl-tRNA synthetase beta subunit
LQFFSVNLEDIHLFIKKNLSPVQEEERIRKNRLSLLRDIADLPRGIADLSVLPGF